MNSRNLDYKKLINDFLQFKRSCGYKYISEEIALKAFYIYTQNNKKSSLGLTKQFLENWSKLTINESRKSLSNRVSLIKEFAIYLNTSGYKAHILTSVKNSRNKSFIPYVFSKDELNQIFNILDNLPNSKCNRYNSHEVYPVLFRMLYGCGLRISEALNLKIKNVDTITGKIHIDVAKYDKQRIVMMSDSLKNICHNYKIQYLSLKDENSIFFQHNDGTRRKKTQSSIYFQKILYKANIPYKGRGKGPYLHNLRHTFACHSFYQMHQNGIDMNVGLSLLSTYLGHKSIRATEKYLKLTQDIFPEIISNIKPVSSNIYMEINYE
jgi:integrase/recombinase XerD